MWTPACHALIEADQGVMESGLRRARQELEGLVLKTYIALLRGINVGGTGLLAMLELVELCSSLGFQSIRTYIQSGNVILESALPEGEVRSGMEKTLQAKMGKSIAVMVRTPAEMKSILVGNPFTDKEPSKVAVAFLRDAPPHDLLGTLVTPGGEQVSAGKKEIYVYYPDGMGKSKLKLPVKGASASVRNINTVARLVAMTEQ